MFNAGKYISTEEGYEKYYILKFFDWFVWKKLREKNGFESLRSKGSRTLWFDHYFFFYVCLP